MMMRNIASLCARPALYEAGEAAFWTDPHISAQMLEAHLNPAHDAASRKPARIRDEVDFLFSTGAVKAGDRLLDLGCGPGLYAVELAKRGVQVTGVDISENSIRHAGVYAAEQGVTVNFRVCSFFDLPDEEAFDAAVQVYGELNVFSPVERDRLLAVIRRALVPGGRFSFDVTTRRAHLNGGERNNWSWNERGFWSEKPHLLLADGFDYPECGVWLDQYLVVEEERTRVFRNWFTDYDAEDVRGFAQSAGFHIAGITDGLSANPVTEESDWLGVRLVKA